MSIRNREKLLGDIAAGLARLELPGVRTPLGSVEVVFRVGDAGYAFGLSGALEALAHDLFWDERGDWAEADRAEVHTI